MSSPLTFSLTFGMGIQVMLRAVELNGLAPTREGATCGMSSAAKKRESLGQMVPMAGVVLGASNSASFDIGTRNRHEELNRLNSKRKKLSNPPESFCALHLCMLMKAHRTLGCCRV